MRKLPVGIQSFPYIREEGYLYVDKTAFLYDLIHKGKMYFLSRPRRFGKSLLLSTLRAYWEGKKELFRRLAIEELERDNPNAWQPYPVFYFDFNKANFERATALEEVLESHLEEWESSYAVQTNGESLEARFQKLIVAARKMTGKRVVVLVDEYDKPLLDIVEDGSLAEHNKAVFKGFFSTLKSYDDDIQFAFLSGVTKFSKVSIFSDLNQLNDISMDEAYAAICGMTADEVRKIFLPEVEAMAAHNGLSVEECFAELQKMYDGYHFHQQSVGIYNPFSLLNAFAKKEFGLYWFATGTPTFLVRKLKDENFDIQDFTNGHIRASAATLSDYRADNPNPVPLLYQTGYLTITDYNSKFRSFTLGYPNEEVKYGFVESLAPAYLYRERKSKPLDIFAFGEDIENGNLDSLHRRFAALYASLPYVSDERVLEQNFQNVAYLVFTLLGQFVRTEVHSAKGRADCIVETERFVYIFEFKRDGSAEEALAQIAEMGYVNVYAADERTVYQVGVNFDSKERTLTGWEVE